MIFDKIKTNSCAARNEGPYTNHPVPEDSEPLQPADRKISGSHSTKYLCAPVLAVFKPPSENPWGKHQRGTEELAGCRHRQEFPSGGGQRGHPAKKLFFKSLKLYVQSVHSLGFLPLSFFAAHFKLCTLCPLGTG